VSKKPEAPLSANEAERLEALGEFDFLYEDQGDALRRLCSLARQFFGVASASVTLVSSDQVNFLSRVGVPGVSRDRCDAICPYTILQDGVFEVEDLKADPRFSQMVDVAAENGIRFYAGVPLSVDPGLPLGTFAIVGLQPRHLTDRERRDLRHFADSAVDLMRFHRLTRKLAQSESLLRQSASLTNIGGWQYLPSTDQYEFSDNLRRLLGLERGEPIDLEALRNRIIEPYRSRLAVGREALLRDGTPYDLEVETTRSDGTRGWSRLIGNAELRDGRVVRAYGSIQDVTETKQAEARIAQLAQHDPLTGLPNRDLFRIRLESAIAESALSGERFALLLADCDNFKTVNDVSGHDVGDVVLKTIAERLNDALGEHDTAARLGGDEFAAILRGVGNRERAAVQARLVLEGLRKPIPAGAKTINISTSIGVAIYPDDDIAATNLMKNSDLALYLAKASGRAQVALFSPPLRNQFDARTLLIEDVRRGIEAGEFELRYEPFCAVDRHGNWSFCGFQALSRWNHPTLGVVTPAMFAPAFEENDLAMRIGEINLSTLRAQLAEWRKNDVPFGSIALTVSDRDLAAGDLGRRIAVMVRDDRVPPGMLTIGVRESVFQSRASDEIATKLGDLRKLGLRVALDDFGNGHTALTYLRTFPLDELWIDRGFVRDLGRNSAGTAIAKAVIDLGLAFGLGVTVEGVETRDQALMLVQMGPIIMRGPYFAGPMAAADVPDLIRSHTVSDGHLHWQMAG
jgi:diguanylate cyclase (GGDEF)-like protein/PAS domain S-box-containing protein